MQRFSPQDFLTHAQKLPIIDVRSPKEYAQGHIVGAHNMPLFSDEERAVIGTLYKQQGKEMALLKGLDFVGVKLSNFVKMAAKIAPDKKILVHCWRGGMRSESVAMLLQYAGFEVNLLKGGYKAYRQYVLESFAQPYTLQVLGGKTGVGKTEILHELADLGEQIIDLEGIACHKGSAFGHLAQAAQPTVEQFENNLFHQLQKLDWQKKIWVESESRSIGRVFIPEGFWRKMEIASFFLVEMPENVRIERLVKEYAAANPDEIVLCLDRIARKLGGVAYQQALIAFEEKDFETATQIVLHYYDKSYQHSREKRQAKETFLVEMTENNPSKVALFLTKLGGETNL